MNISGLEGPACWSSMTRKEFGCPWDCCCRPLLATWLCLTGWMTWLEGICVSGMVKMYSLAVEMSVAQMLKLHLSYVKVSVAVAAGADDHVLLSCFECC